MYPNTTNQNTSPRISGISVNAYEQYPVVLHLEQTLVATSPQTSQIGIADFQRIPRRSYAKTLAEGCGSGETNNERSLILPPSNLARAPARHVRPARGGVGGWCSVLPTTMNKLAMCQSSQFRSRHQCGSLRKASMMLSY